MGRGIGKTQRAILNALAEPDSKTSRVIPLFELQRA
jgi:hypothetical protein